MKTNILLILFFSFACIPSTLAQKHFEQKESKYTYIFEISESQALSFFEENRVKLDKNYYERLIDSFPASESYQNDLPIGHYIKTNSNKNLQHTYYQSVKDFEVFVFNNAKDLIVQVYNKGGEILSDVEVTIDNKALLYDDDQMAFIDEKSNKRGILKVKHQNFSAFYHLSRTQNSSFLNRSAKKLAYNYPSKYVWLPIEYLAMLPVDGVKSLQQSYAQGTIQQTKRFFIKLYEKVGCWFGADDYRCDKNNQEYEVGYFVLSKPKYKPNDTIKGKAFIWDEKGNPIDKELYINLSEGYQNTIKVGKISPFRKGSYNLKFHLHDSLDLDLDKSYSVVLVDDSGNSVAQNRFSYEDYQLKGIKLHIQVNSSDQFKGEELKVTLDARDENDLRILDASVEIQLLSLESNFQAEDYVFVPDTLWSHQLNLETTSSTEFSIPKTIFPKANLEYKLLAKLRTSDQKYIEATEQINYYFESEKINHQIVGDSIIVEFLKNGKRISSDIRIESLDHFGNANQIFAETTPFKFQIDPLHKAYRFFTNDLEKKVDLNSVPTGISARLFRTSDSVYIKVNNPNQYPFHYHIFRKNEEIEKGFASELDFSEKDESLTNYYLTLNYVWAGKVVERNFSIPFKGKDLTLKVNQPRLIYPGQKVNVEIEVLNNNQQPVENADVLSYGMTSKFNFKPNGIKNYSTKPNNRKLRNSFKLDDIRNQVFEGPLDISIWNDFANLKRLSYYQLIYPGTKLFEHEFELENEPTQFAPFVVDHGELVPVHIIYIDKKPVYFSDMTNNQPYSFAVDNRPVKVQLRTINHLITLDSVQFSTGNKTIISLDVNQNYPGVIIEKVPPALTETERNKLLQYVMPYRLRNKGFAFLQNKDRFHVLQSSSNNYSGNQFIGPIHNQSVKFFQDKQYELSFNLESYYQYDFNPMHLKQRPFSKDNFPTFLSHKDIPDFYDLVLTKEKINLLMEMDIVEQKKKIKLFSYPNVTSMNRGTLDLKHKQKTSNIVLANLNDENDFRVYQGSVKKIYDLKPGEYRLILIYPSQNYSLVDSIFIKPNGTNFYKIENMEVRNRDSFSDKMSEIVTDFLINRNSNNSEFYKSKLKQVYEQNSQFMGESHTFSGVVNDQDGLPLPGVNIMVSGTNYGTRTDFDGNFQLHVPKQFNEVELVYIGYETLTLNVCEDRYQQIRLTKDQQSLDEVVVMGYSVRKRRDEVVLQNEIIEGEGSGNNIGFLPYSMLIKLLEGKLSVLKDRPNASLTQTLSGQISGIMISSNLGAPGKNNLIMLRGVNSLEDLSDPLIVINGVPYDGSILDLSVDLIQEITILKDASATAIYGSRGKNGVVLISTTQTDLQVRTTEKESTPEFALENSEANGIRTNFSDEAFWKTNLSTNQEGKVNFSITYPDDVTSWDTHFFVATESQETGQANQSVKSYRPLVSQLSIPKFLILGDSVSGIGKIKNYMGDSIAIVTQFKINEEIQFKKEKEVSDFETDELSIIASNLDSLQINYQFKHINNNYIDGEELTIPVFTSGMEKAEGEFLKLLQNDTLRLNFVSNMDEVELKIEANLNSILEQELDVVINYMHDCNEQIASRLKAQLTKRKIYQERNLTFEDDKDIKKLMRLLQKNQQSNSLWGWWSNSSSNLWVSLNVIEALLLADEQEFKLKWNKGEIQQTLTERLFLDDEVSERVQLLQILDVLKTEINYLEEIESLLQKESLSVVERFQLWEMYQKHNGSLNLIELMKFQKETALGNWYIESEEKYAFHPYKNSIQASLIAYRILKKMDNQEEVAEKFKDYLVMQRNYGGFTNTFESMQVIETLIGEFKNSQTNAKYRIQINNDAWQTYDRNSYSQSFQASDEVKVLNSGLIPIYLNYIQKYVDETPEKRDDLFEVNTHFENEFEELLQIDKIKAGKPVSLEVRLDVKKQANYFMLEVPIPSGFSYHNKMQYSNETHRQYRKDKTYIFIETLEPGIKSFSIELMPRFQGNYQLKAAKAQLMYFEQFSGNNIIKSLKVIN
jgi:TonB-dependent SusC/RagA subfamily outer membrane receptor